MSRWIHGRPSGLVRRTLVFVDTDNLLIQDDCPYTPIHSVAEALKWVVNFAGEIAEDPGIYAFVDMQREHPNSDRGEFATACDSLGITVIHTPSNQHGRDQVDSGIINEWFNQHRNLPLEVPFILVSLDKDFIPMLDETSQKGRPIYIGLPTQQFYPPHVQRFQGCSWLDSLADQHRSMSFLLNEDGSRAKPEFEAKFERLYRDHARWRRAFTMMSQEFANQPNRVFENLASLLHFLTVIWRDLGISSEEATKVVPYMVYYRALLCHEGRWQPNVAHRLTNVISG